MWNLIAEQLRYRRRGLVVTGVLTLVVGFVVCFFLQDPTRHYRVWALVLLVASGGTNLYLWTLDQKERRSLLWASLPLRRRDIAAARLLSVFCVQAAFFGLCLLGALVTDRLVVHRGPDFAGVGWLLICQGFALVSVAFVFLYEEVMLQAVRRRWGVILANTAAILSFAMLTLFALRALESFESWQALVALHVLAVAFMGIAYSLFVRRQDLLMGVNAITGCPENWSSSAR